MGKVKTNKTKKDDKAILMAKIGVFLADLIGAPIDRTKDGMIIMLDNGKDCTVRVVEKKEAYEFDESEVIETYSPTEIVEEENEQDEQDEQDE